MFLNGHGCLYYSMQLSHIHGLKFTHDVKLEKKDLKKTLLFYIKTRKDIPEEVRNKYTKRYEMEKFYGKVIHWSEYEEKEASYPKDKKARKETYEESHNEMYAKIAEKRQAVNFCPDCIKECGVCGERTESTFHVGVLAHPSCNERYRKNRLCGKCGEKTEIGGLFHGHVCGSCCHKVSAFHCFFFRDKIEID